MPPIPRLKLGPKALWPAIVLLGALVLSTALVVARPKAKPVVVDANRPVVQVVRAEPGPVRMRLHATGTVEPRVETDLVAEVAGRVAWVSPSLDAGRPFRKGDVLLRVEPRDYQNAVERAQAAVERAQSQMTLRKSALERQRALRKGGAVSEAVLEQADSAAKMADADLRDAQAVLSQARLDLERTQLRAPFDGEVRKREVSLGQYLRPGVAAARIFSLDRAEVRLALPTADVAFLDLPKPGDDTAPVRHVWLTGTFAGHQVTWEGRLARFEDALDPQTRMVHVVAEVPDPRGHDGQPPLPMGLFVNATIEGRKLDPVVELPRSALRGDDVIVVDRESRLRLRKVKLLRTDGDLAWVGGGLASGERVVATPPPMLVEGMPVRTAPTELARSDTP